MFGLFIEVAKELLKLTFKNNKSPALNDVDDVGRLKRVALDGVDVDAPDMITSPEDVSDITVGLKVDKDISDDILYKYMLADISDGETVFVPEICRYP